MNSVTGTTDLEAALYLVPSALSLQGSPERVLPPYNLEVMRGLRHFVVENVRTARRFLRRCIHDFPIDECSFAVLDEHTPAAEVAALLAPLEAGKPMGVISEAGCPAVADPGADLVAVAQRKGLKVVPLVGPSSILLALMASGFNGQSFAFLGYLPVEAEARAQALQAAKKAVLSRRQTQIFIETPYRNQRLIEQLCAQLPAQMLLCVAADLTGPGEMVRTAPLSYWSKTRYDLSKTPAIFLLYS